GLQPLSYILVEYRIRLVIRKYCPEIHGASLRGIAAHPNIFPKQSETLGRVYRDEGRGADYSALEQFAHSVQEFRGKLRHLLLKLKREGKRIVGYGAPAKATTLLNYCSIDSSIV